MGMLQSVFYLWWLLVNAFISFAEFQFLLRFSVSQKQQRDSSLCIVYVGANCVLTLLVLLFPLPVLFNELLHIGIIFILAICFLKHTWSETVISVVILFSLSTFTEGVSAILMRWLRTRLTEPWLGSVLQMTLTVILAFLFFLSLYFISKRYGFTARQAVSPYLYVLLLPCAFVVWVVRFGFGLNSTTLSETYAPFGNVPLFMALLLILGAVITFAMILIGFGKIITLTQQETEGALLKAQHKEQEIYLAEALKREEQYRSFQHDIDNHFAVLSGLLQEEKYDEAKQYFLQLHMTSSSLVRHIATGMPALDVLLGEKISYARQNHITVSCHASLPSRLSASVMDVCIILANALDNAIKACLQKNQEKSDITITVKPHRQFLVIEVTNSIPSTVTLSYGTGLTNISRTADKYQGSMEIEQTGGRFRLSVLLCLGGDTKA